MLNADSIKAINNSGTTGGWKGELQGSLDKFDDIRVNGKKASNRTKDILCVTLWAGFNEIHDLGFRVMPRNFGNRHMQILVDE